MGTGPRNDPPVAYRAVGTPTLTTAPPRLSAGHYGRYGRRPNISRQARPRGGGLAGRQHSGVGRYRRGGPGWGASYPTRRQRREKGALEERSAYHLEMGELGGAIYSRWLR